MVKSGLFFASIGFLLLVVGAVGSDMSLQSLPLLILALILIVLGGGFFFRGVKASKKIDKEDGANESE